MDLRTIDATHHREPPWVDIAGMRDQLAHRQFDTSHTNVQVTVDSDLLQWQRQFSGWCSRSPRTTLKQSSGQFDEGTRNNDPAACPQPARLGTPSAF
jgi:hypothetical protein